MCGVDNKGKRVTVCNISKQGDIFMIRKAERTDLIAITQLAILLWPDNEFDDLKKEVEEKLLDKDAVFYLCFDKNILVGFAQCQLRHDYVEGTESSPVGYLEVFM